MRQVPHRHIFLLTNVPNWHILRFTRSVRRRGYTTHQQDIIMTSNDDSIDNLVRLLTQLYAAGS